MKALLAVLFCLVGVIGQAQERLSVARSDGAQVPILDFKPDAAGCAPLVILSHGFGGNERGLTSLARDLLAQGFRAITMAHRESGRAQLRAVLRSADRRLALANAVSDRAANVARMRDLEAVWNYAMQPCRPGFAALAGHSMGAQLTVIEAGAVTTIGVRGKDRFDAYVALSPQGVGPRFDQRAWRGIKKPMLMVTGTLDAGLEGDWRNRVSAFDGLPKGHKWLAVLDGGTHMDMSGQRSSTRQRNVRVIVLAFVKALGKPSAKDMPRLPGVSYRMK